MLYHQLIELARGAWGMAVPLLKTTPFYSSSSPCLADRSKIRAANVVLSCQEGEDHHHRHQQCFPKASAGWTRWMALPWRQVR